MAKSRPPKRILESYTIKGSDKVIKPGDCVLMRAYDTSKPPYVARVEAIEAAGSRGTNVRVRVRWYYRPEESIGGRRPFHGSKEVFLSDHYDVQSADTIEGKCNVHSFRSYTKLDSVNAEDFFCRFEYKSASGSFVPDRIAVFCKCEMPYNPDDLMIQCEDCSDWFHPACIGMTIKEAKKLEHFFCQTCTAENGKMAENSHEATAQSEEKILRLNNKLPKSADGYSCRPHPPRSPSPLPLPSPSVCVQHQHLPFFNPVASEIAQLFNQPNCSLQGKGLSPQRIPHKCWISRNCFSNQKVNMAEALVIVVLQKITSALGEQGLKILGSKLQKQLPDIQEVTNRMRLLQSDFSMMQAFISQVDVHRSNDKVLEAWVEQVRQAAHEAENIVDEYIYLVGQMEGTDSFLKRALTQAADAKKWRKLAAQAKFMEDCLQKITETKKRFDVSATDSRKDITSSYCSRLQHLSDHSFLNDEADFVGNAEEVKCLTEWLSDARKNRTVISVCGMGGLGKTTIASSIYKKEEIERMFICRAWISVSQSYRVKDLLKRILLQLTTKNENNQDGIDTMDCVNLVQLLQTYLKDRRYLIVLDDVWSRDSWPLLDSAFVKNNSGSRIIITTRVQAVASLADKNHEMKLSLLPKEEAWTLFSQKAFARLHDRSCPLNLKASAERIVDKCQGLPLALVALGSLLSYKEMDEHKWELFYSQLRWQLSNNPELTWVASVLNLSYNDLPSYLKNCFLYCSMFPEDYQIERKRLIRLWIAEGFIEDRGPETILSEVAACYLKELADRSLLQVVDRNEYGRPKKFQMHDLVRELSLTISKKEKFATTWDHPNSDCNSDGCRRLSVQKDGNLMQTVTNSAQLRSVIVFVEEVSSSWFKDCYSSFRLLRVLSLRHCHIQKVPDNVSNLFILHYLDLGYTKLKEMSRSIGKLSNLQTLYLKGSVLELPSDVTMLTKLQHLIIDVGRFGSSASNKIRRLEHLQTLKNIEANSCLIRNLGCFTRMRSLGIRKVLESYNTDLWTSISKMTALTSLSVIAADRDRDVLDLSGLKPLPYLEKLMLSGKLEKGAIPPVFGHFPKLKSLRLCFSGLHEDPLAQLSVMFQNLGHLSLYRCYDGTRLTFRAGWFPMLKHLYLSSMGELKDVEIEDSTMRALHRLELWGLKSLMSVPEGLVHLKSLQQLCIGSMMPDEFKRRLEGRDRWIVEHIPYIGDP